MPSRLQGRGISRYSGVRSGISKVSRFLTLLLIASGLTTIVAAPAAQAVTLLPGSISAGADHSCGLTGDGAAYCWGDDSSGELGNGAVLQDDQISPSPVDTTGPLPDAYTSISAGTGFTCAIATGGAAYCWGAGTGGQLGSGSSSDSSVPVAVAGGHSFSAVSAGADHSCGIEVATGSGYCWGADASGQLGNGSTSGVQSSPSAVDSTASFTAISAGNAFTCAIASGSAYCWGSDASGQLGNGDLGGDGSADPAQESPYAVDVSALGSPPTWSSISAGASHSCALTGGTAYCWGSDGSGELGNGDLGNDTTPDLDQASPSAVATGSYASISAGNAFTCALTSGGSAYCWGSDSDGKLGDGSAVGPQISPSAVSGGQTFAALSAGSAHACAYTEARGAAYCWGSDTDGRLGNGSIAVTQPAPSQVVSRIDILRAGLGTGTVTYSSTIDCGIDCFEELGFLASVSLAAAPSAKWSNAGTCTTGTSCTYTILAPAVITVIFTGAVPAERISAGTAHTCALTPAGAPYCWGADASGQVGDGSTVGPQVSPAVVSGGLILASVSVGGAHSCGRTSGGVVSCWGSDTAGQLGDGGAFTSSTTPVAVSGGLTFDQVVTGASHSCGLTSVGQAYCWGSDASGQLGNGDIGAAGTPDADQPAPYLVDTAQSFVELSAGGSHTCGITELGAAYCWGSDTSGQLGNGSTTGIQESPFAVEMPVLTAFVEITAGTSHTCARTAGGAVYCWGSDASGQLGNNSAAASQPSPTPIDSGVLFSRISAGGSHTCGLNASDAAYCWGSDGSGQLGNAGGSASQVPTAVNMPASTTFTSVSAGSLHTCAWSGTYYYCWGSDTDGQLGNGGGTSAAAPGLVVSKIDILRAGLGIDAGTVTYSSTINCPTDCSEELAFLAAITLIASPSATWSNAGTCTTGTSCAYAVLNPAAITVSFAGTLTGERISAGTAHACALTTAGAPYCWGSDASGQVGDGATVGPQASPVAVTPSLVATSIQAGTNHTCALSSSNVVSCWGSDSAGQLGDGGAAADSTIPVTVAGAYIQVVTGGSHSCAMTSAGAVSCWGSDASGQLGNGATSGNQLAPSAISPAQAFIQISAGASHTCGITATGTAFCWGSDSDGQLGNGSLITSDQVSPYAVEMPALAAFVKITAGASHTCALTAAGAAYCWGSDTSGQLGNGAGGSSSIPVPVTMPASTVFKQISAGASHTCALTPAGAPYCWGSDASGQLGDLNAGASAISPIAVAMPTATTFTGVSAGTTSTCAWSAVGTGWCWGDDGSGRLGNGVATTTTQQTPTLVGADLWMLKAGTGRGSVTFSSTAFADPVSACAAACASQRVTAAFNNQVQLGATASGSEDFFGSGTSTFRGWTGGGCAGTSTCTVPYSAVANVAAMFRGAVTQDRVAAGLQHSCALDSNDLAWCWGTGTAGQLGRGSTASADVPVQAIMPSGRSFAQISTGATHTCAVAYDGTAWCWGNGADGRLGNGATTNVSVPTAVALPPFTTFVEVTAGLRHTCAVAYDGKAYCWGYGSDGRLGNGSTANASSPAEVTSTSLAGATFRRISAGQDHTCAIASTGAAWCWGLDTGQQLGDGASTGGSTTPTAVTTSGGRPSAYSRISAGSAHSCGLTPSGAAWCWGTNTDGRLGDNTTTAASSPVAVATTAGLPAAYSGISAGSSSTCGRTAAGAVWCWGSDANGRLGNGAGGASLVPSTVSPAIVADQMVVGTNHACTTVFAPTMVLSCWGYDLSGQLGNGSYPTADQPSPFQVGAHLDLIKVGTGSGSVTSVPAGISCLQACDTQTYTVPFGTTTPVSLALTATPVSGSVSLTGSTCTGIATCTIAVTSSDAVTATFTAVAGTDLALIDAGTLHSCVVTGGVGGCWGGDANGQLGDDTSLLDRASPTSALMPAGVTYSEISAGTAHTCALATSGAAYCWGSDGNGRLGNGSGSVSDLAVASLVAGGLVFKQVAAGLSHTCALTTAGAAYCWGNDTNGQVGNGATTGDQPSPSPVTMPAGRTFTNIAAGGSHTCALADNGTIYCWGSDLYGQLGNGATTGDQFVPSLVSGALTFTAMSVGTYHSCALTSAGAAYCWGLDQNGRLGLGAVGAGTAQEVPTSVVMPASTTFVRISAGNAHNCALTFGGSLYCWGFNSSGQVGNGGTTTAVAPVLIAPPTGTSRFLRVAAGEQHTCALADDTTTVADDVSRWCWGNDTNGRLGNGTTITASPFTSPSRATSAIVVTVSGGGTVTWASPLSGVCPVTCTQDVATDATASMTAAPTANYTFLGWSGPCANPASLTCVVPTTWSQSVTASFSSVPSFILTLTKAAVSGGVGTVTSSPSGISCGTTCTSTTASFASGTTVTLVPSAPSGSTFSGWSGACTNLTGNCIVSITGALTVNATFTSTTAGTFALSVSKTSVGAGAGSVSSSPTGISCGTTCTFNYGSGTVVILTATPASGSLFGGWTGACTNASGTCSVLMDQARSVSAKFYTTRKMTVGKTGSGTVVSSPAGINCGSTCIWNFEYGTSVTLTPTPAAGWKFDRWTGSCIGTTCTLTTSADFTVTANFVQITYALSVTKSSVSSGSGSVGSSPTGISCGTTCTASFASGSTVTLTATAASGSVFSGWSGACTNLTGTCTVLMDQARSVTATFTGRRTLTVTRTGSGTVTSSPAGISCGTTCSASFNYGTGVSLTATPATGYRFTGWSGSCSGLTCNLTMNSNYSVTANFGIAYTLTVTKGSVGGATGTVTSSPAGISCGATCSATFASGTSVTLTATAGAGYRFTGWSGACTGTSSTCVVSMAANRSVTANFST